MNGLEPRYSLKYSHLCTKPQTIVSTYYLSYNSSYYYFLTAEIGTDMYKGTTVSEMVTARTTLGKW